MLCSQRSAGATPAISDRTHSRRMIGTHPWGRWRRVGWHMLHGQKIAVILPAYNADRTLRKTYEEIPQDIVDDIILTDDASVDSTAELARSLGIYTLKHDSN